MKKLLFITVAIVFSSLSYSQILITDADLDTLNPLDCIANSGPAANFFDSGNTGSNYGSNENETIVICPDYAGGASKLILSFGINVGLTFDVDASDTIYVYDGPNTSAPLLGKHNSSTDPFGFTHSSSFINNPTGCLTIQFISDGAIEGTGWDANIRCVQLPQPIEAHMQGFLNGTGPDIITPSDTGYIDMCFGDSILFVATSIFPYSSDVTGIGYSQNNTNVTYQWDISNGLQATGDSLWFKPPSRNGFVIRLKTTDMVIQEESIQSKIRVSTIPSFSGVIITRNSICVGDTTVVIGAVTATDTSGVDPTLSGFQTGGTFAGLTFLPDGSNATYTTTINIGGYDPGDMITAASDIQQLRMKMEHSWLGDLEMILACPNGTQTTIFNSYSGAGGLVPGGFGGGSTYLGDALDDGTTNPGIGWDYRWSTVNATLGDFATELAGGNTIATTLSPGLAMDTNGIYLPEQTFANFIGCPLNGAWTITVKDNQSIDNGFIFEWEIILDTVFTLNDETYVPNIVSSQWLTAATILPGLPTDTFIVVTSNTPGPHGYTFEVTDSYGCVYDTTVFVEFIPAPSIQVNGNGNACEGQYQVTGTTSFAGGSWAYSGPGTATFSPSQNVENPSVSVDVNGTYSFTFTDFHCLIDSTIDIYFADSVFVSLDSADFCVGDEATLDATSQVTEATYSWSTGATSPTLNVTDSGTYYVVITGLCNQNNDTVSVTTVICDIFAPNVITPNGDGENDFLFFEGLDRYPGSTLQVFNRWGNQVYESNDYQNDWSPTDVSGGTYFYILTPGGILEADIIKNTVTVFVD